MTAELTGRIVTPDGVVGGVLRIEGEQIAAITPQDVPEDAPWLVPGFVDMHCHGGGGHTFTTGDAGQARAAAAFHAGHGTTTLLASLVSAPQELTVAAVRAYAPLVAEGVIAGVHSEGPYLAEACRGAQNPAFLRDPSPRELRELLDAAGPGVIRMMTIAPERPGALDAIRFLADHGAVAAIGHTDATYEQVKAGIAAGARVGTHVFNGMKPPHHRAPGPVYALLAASGVACELIADGAHLADGTIEFALSAVGPARAALITDAITAAGMPDGDYELGGQAVLVRGGTARLAIPEGPAGPASVEATIAGSTLTMDAAFRRVARMTGSLATASAAASTVPARALGLHDRGVLASGLRADVVALDGDLAVTAVIRAGAPVPTAAR